MAEQNPTITLDILGNQYEVIIRHPEFSVREALSCIDDQFNVRSPLDGREYVVSNYGVEKLLELRVLEARDHLDIPVGGVCVPSEGAKISIDYFVEEPVPNTPGIPVNKYGELVTAEEYIGFRETLGGIWQMRVAEARKLVTPDELKEAKRKYDQRKEEIRKRRIEDVFKRGD